MNLNLWVGLIQSLNEKKKKKETDEEKGIKKIDPEAMLKALISKL